MSKELRFVSLCGILGYGYPEESLRTAARDGVSFIGVDAGSTDPGPFYLGSGVGFVRETQVRRDLAPALRTARQLNVPLIVGTGGGSGAQPHLESFLRLVRDLAREQGLHFRMAIIPADIDKETVLEAMSADRIAPCGPVPPLTGEAVTSCSQIVGQMGTAPLIRALEGGADVVIAGRCCDAAIFAALPIMRGFDVGLALHLGKIAECGALCAQPAGVNDAIYCILREDSFLVEPPNPARRCTPESVAAHSLYEQPDPDCFHEPEGTVDTSACDFAPHGDRAVRVSGSRFLPGHPPTIKLEGAALCGYRAVTIAGVRDPSIIGHLAELEVGVREAVARNLADVRGEASYSLRFLRYGIDAVLGPLEPHRNDLPHEVGIVIDAIASSQDLANAVISLARSTALHQDIPGRKTTAGNLAFPFSPSDLPAGPVYEFRVYHLMTVDDPAALFPVRFEEV